jgi:hypothetical protein
MHSLDNILDAAVAIFERGGSAASAAATPHFLHEKFELLRGHNYYIFTKHIYGSILIQMVNKLNFFCPALFFWCILLCCMDRARAPLRRSIACGCVRA